MGHQKLDRKNERIERARELKEPKEGVKFTSPKPPPIVLEEEPKEDEEEDLSEDSGYHA